MSSTTIAPSCPLQVLEPRGRGHEGSHGPVPAGGARAGNGDTPRTEGSPPAGSPAAVAISRFVERAEADAEAAAARWSRAVGPDGGDLGVWAERFAHAGRLTLNFHPDRRDRRGRTVAEGLLHDGRYRSQWQTGISAGSRSAIPGGERHRFERQLFDDAYAAADARMVEHPIYGALDLLFDPHGGSPRFGSSFVVLRDRCRRRTTLCVGDSNTRPRDVGTPHAPWSVLAGLAEQAARHELLNRGLGIDVLLAAVGPRYRSARPSRDGYIEAQVHGGISLREDVDEVVLDPSFRGTPVERAITGAAERYRFGLRWHVGSELAVDAVPDDFRGPGMPRLAREVAGSRGVVDARAIGEHAARLPFTEPTRMGDDPASDLQQLKYLWHTVLAFGRDGART